MTSNNYTCNCCCITNCALQFKQAKGKNYYNGKYASGYYCNRCFGDIEQYIYLVEKFFKDMKCLDEERFQLLITLENFIDKRFDRRNVKSESD